MGKSFTNFMCKKDFHPKIYDKKKQEELMEQFLKEQESYDNRLLMGDECVKNGLNFMCEAPPGAKKENKEKEETEGETEYKIEWQKGAPQEKYAKDDMNIRDQPLGIQWGHVNTDQECPLFGPSEINASSIPTDGSGPSMHPLELIAKMRNSGFALKGNILGRNLTANDPSQEYVPSEGEEDPEVECLKSLTKKDRKKKKFQKSRNKHKKHKSFSSFSSSSSSSSSTKTSESSSESESDNKEKKIGRKERKASVQGISHSDSEEKDLCKKRKLHEELSGSHHNQEKAKEKLTFLKYESSRENSKWCHSDSDKKSRSRNYSPEKRGSERNEGNSRPAWTTRRDRVRGKRKGKPLRMA
uniref:CBF1-interacting co-repressor CIR N-terminal domain-containing protein n=1 Tax=Rhinopithecus roxellana TaxID=61622 RepID=A0A2K6Q561_RHIRO